MKQKILVTGSSGYVCSFLIPLLASKFDVLAVDVKPGKHTNVIMDIVDLNSHIISLQQTNMLYSLRVSAI